MKKLFVLLFVMILVNTGFSLAKKTGWELDKLKGKVSERIMILYSIDNRSGNQNKIIGERYIYKYNDKGNKVEEVTYSPYGDFLYRSIYKYGAKGNIVEVAKHDFEGNLMRQEIYDDKGNMTQSANYDKGDLKGKSIYKYDDKGNKVEEGYYGTDGSSKDKSIYKYDDKGNKVEEAYYEKGDLKRKDIYKYQYDNLGNIINTSEYTSKEKFGEMVEEMTHFTAYLYTYYK